MSDLAMIYLISSQASAVSEYARFNGVESVSYSGAEFVHAHIKRWSYEA